MTTSGTDSWNPVLLDIIRDALININAIDENENPTAHDYQEGLRKINNLVKGLETTGIHVWTEEEGILFLQPGQQLYVIGGPDPTLNAHTSLADEWERLTLAQPAASGATTITLETGEGLLVASGMHLGIITNDGLTQWTTASGAPAGDVVTLADALLVGADAGTYVLAYTTPLPRPLQVPKARLLTLVSLQETPMTILSRQGYMDLPNKRSPGVPTQWFYSPRRNQGELRPWPVESTSAYAIRFTWYRSLQDFLVPTNTMDLPQEWINAITWNLSRELGPGYSVPPATWDRVILMSETWAIANIGYDREPEPIEFGMDYWAYGD